MTFGYTSLGFRNQMFLVGSIDTTSSDSQGLQGQAVAAGVSGMRNPQLSVF